MTCDAKAALQNPPYEIVGLAGMNSEEHGGKGSLDSPDSGTFAAALHLLDLSIGAQNPSLGTNNETATATETSEPITIEGIRPVQAQSTSVVEDEPSGSWISHGRAFGNYKLGEVKGTWKTVKPKSDVCEAPSWDTLTKTERSSFKQKIRDMYNANQKQSALRCSEYQRQASRNLSGWWRR